MNIYQDQLYKAERHEHDMKSAQQRLVDDVLARRRAVIAGLIVTSLTISAGLFLLIFVLI